MMKKIALILVLAALGWTACVPGNKKITSGNALQGLASPIRLQLDTTRVWLTDYFPDAAGIESILWNGITWQADSAGMLILTGAPYSAVSNLHVIYAGNAYDIPVFSTNKVRYTFTYKPSRADVSALELSGSMNGWNRKASPLVKNGDTWSIEFVLTQGLYQYRIWEDGQEMMDASNPSTISNGMGGLNNTFRAGTEQSERPVMITSETDGSSITLLDLDTCKNVYAYLDNELIQSSLQNGKIRIQVPNKASDRARSHIRVFADNGLQRYNDVLIPLEHGKVVTSAAQLNRKDLRNTVMYFVMVDRFVDGDSTNNRPTLDPAIHPKANNLRGDLQGITQKIKDGYFENLGINTIWISPITTNAEGAWGLWNKGVESKFSAYHGYWPTALRSIEWTTC